MASEEKPGLLLAGHRQFQLASHSTVKLHSQDRKESFKKGQKHCTGRRGGEKKCGAAMQTSRREQEEGEKVLQVLEQRLLAAPGEAHSRAGRHFSTETHAPMLEHSYTKGLQPTERIHARAQGRHEEGAIKTDHDPHSSALLQRIGREVRYEGVKLSLGMNLGEKVVFYIFFAFVSHYANLFDWQ